MIECPICGEWINVCTGVENPPDVTCSCNTTFNVNVIDEGEVELIKN